MQFSDDEGLRLAGESLDRLFARDYGFEHRKAYSQTIAGWSTDVWTSFAGAGLIGLLASEQDGGFGDVPGGISVLFWRVGQVLALEPYLATLLSIAAVEQSGSDGQREALIGGMISGTLRCAFVHETASGRGVTWQNTEEQGILLSGEARLVLNGADATHLIVAAQNEPGAAHRLFAVEAAQPGLSRRFYRLQDGTPAADLIFSGVSAEALGDLASATSAIALANSRGIAAICTAAAGAMDALLLLTLEYMKTRVQFGKPIGANQALQHRAANMRIWADEAKSIILLVKEALEQGDSADAHALAQGKYVIGDLARRFGYEALQLHGSISLTEEYSASHYYRFLVVAQKLFGDTANHLSKLAAWIN